MRLLGAKKEPASIFQVEKEGQRVEDLVENCNYKTRISFIPNCFITSSSVAIYLPFNFLAISFAQTISADY